MSRLSIQMLGSFRVLVDNSPIPEQRWRSKNTKGLLAYLVINKVVPREKLMVAFWPECDQVRARANMCSTVRYVRRAFESSGIEQEYVSHQQGQYAFTPGIDYSVDVDDFTEHVVAGLQATHVLEAARHYQAAVNLYQGEYMDGFYYDWVTWPRELLKGQYLGALEKLAAINLRCGYLDQAAQHCHRILAINSCWEQAHRMLVEVYVQQGHRSQAIHQYDLMRQTLEAELGVTLPQESVATYERLIETGKPPSPFAQTWNAPLQPAQRLRSDVTHAWEEQGAPSSRETAGHLTRCPPVASEERRSRNDGSSDSPKA